METETLLDESLLLSEPVVGSSVAWETNVLGRHHSEIESIDLVRGISDPFEFSSEIESSYLMNTHAIQFDEQFCRHIQQSPPTFPAEDFPRSQDAVPLVGISIDDEESLYETSKIIEHPVRQQGFSVMDLFSKPFTCGSALKCGLHGCQSDEEEILFTAPEDYDIDEIPFFDDNVRDFYSPNLYKEAAAEEDDLFQSMKIHSLSSDRSADTASTDQDLSSDGSNNSKPTENDPMNTSGAINLNSSAKSGIKGLSEAEPQTLTTRSRDNSSSSINGSPQDTFSQNSKEELVSHSLTSPSSLSFSRNWSTTSSSVSESRSPSGGEKRANSSKVSAKENDYWSPVERLPSNISDEESLPSASLLKSSGSILKKKSSFPRRQERLPSATKLEKKKRSVSFHYPEVSAFKQYAKIEPKDKPKLFFTEDELDEAEQDRYESRYFDDVECVHVEKEQNQAPNFDTTLKEVSAPEDSKRKSNKGLISKFLGGFRKKKDKKTKRSSSNPQQVLVFLRERSKH